jgi:hypothetical protein
MAAMSTDPPRSERDILRRAVELISDRLPAAWTSQTREEVTLDGRRRADAVLALRAPDGSRANVVIEAKRAVETRDVLDVASQLGRLRELASEDGQPAGALLAAPYLNPAARVRLAENGIGYADATGNLLLRLDRPALFLRDVGTDKDPWRGPGRPRGSFKGGTAARVFRALVDFSPPMTVPQLVERSGASTGVTYRVVDFLEREDMLKRASGSGIVEVDWRQLIERWSQQYGFARSASMTAFLEPHGLDAALDRLRGDDLRYALTGSIAADYYEPYAPTRAIQMYVTSVDEAASRLGLRRASTGANVLVAVPEDPVAFARTRRFEGLTIAAPSQVAVDLLGGPGRAPEEARALIEWMKANEQTWRR